MSDTKSPADAIAPALRDEAELRELARLYAKWWRQNRRRLQEVITASESLLEREEYIRSLSSRGLP